MSATHRIASASPPAAEDAGRVDFLLHMTQSGHLSLTHPGNALDEYLATQGATRRLDLLRIDAQDFKAKVRAARRAVTERKTETYISSPAI